MLLGWCCLVCCPQTHLLYPNRCKWGQVLLVPILRLDCQQIRRQVFNGHFSRMIKRISMRLKTLIFLQIISWLAHLVIMFFILNKKKTRTVLNQLYFVFVMHDRGRRILALVRKWRFIFLKIALKIALKIDLFLEKMHDAQAFLSLYFGVFFTQKNLKKNFSQFFLKFSFFGFFLWKKDFWGEIFKMI